MLRTTTALRLASHSLGLLAAFAAFGTAHADKARMGNADARAREISAFYMFRSWDDPSKLVMIMNVHAGQNPADGPDYFGFADDAVYRLSIDNDLNGVADDLVYEIRFKTELRSGTAGYAWPLIGNPLVADSRLRGITALDGPGSEGLGVRQRYSVVQIREGVRTQLLNDQKLIAVPSNAGPATMPAYDALAAQGIYRDAGTGVRVFAGQRADTFYRDTGALYDGVNMRRSPPLLSEAEDNNNVANPFGVNRFRHANVQSIAVEIPIEMATVDGKSADATMLPLIGAYASVHLRNGHGGHDGHATRQVSRMGNPSFRVFLVDPANRAGWDAGKPENDAQFQELLKTPAIVPLLEGVTGIPAAPSPRMDLVQIILKYPNQSVSGTDCGVPCSDLLRMNLRVPPTPAEGQWRMGALLSPDPAGLPNGCRPTDDITDITLRAFGGPAYFFARIGDGVNFQDSAPGAGTGDGPGYGTMAGNRLDVTANGITKEFPFQPTPHSGWGADVE